MKGALRLVLGDQLTPGLASLRDANPACDLILMAEVRSEATYVRHHKKKIAFVFAAMRAFSEELQALGFTVRYVAISDPENAGDLLSETRRALSAHPDLDRVVLTRCGEWRLDEAQAGWQEALGVPVERRDDDRFLCSIQDFNRWAEGKKQLRMEFFYREMRRRTGLLMEGGEPAGGRWNFDAENRKRLPKGVTPPERRFSGPCTLAQAAMADVEAHFLDHFGDLEPFVFPVCRAEAEALAARFITDILPGFGDWQDAMARGAPWMWHAVLSPCLNAGLLDPLALCQAAEAEWRAGRAPLNAVEGFIRQIIGWREYVRGIYWRFMPDYGRLNALEARRSLPDFYWTGRTDMACLREAITDTRRHAYAHHIQRLMVTGNFALLAGVDPNLVDEWYLIVYADAYEWVEMPNTRGMALFADGGIMASKPYAASGAYIDKMSDYCGGCAYSVSEKNGPKACPFNYLYWDFMMRNEARLRANPRLANPYATLGRLSAARKAAISQDAAAFLDRVAPMLPRSAT
jgi:deoxyribodipyrimidine photolyase-related protein